MSEQVQHIESLCEQGSGRLNEDKLVCTQNLFGVFDGASSLIPELFHGKTGAWWASHLAGSEFVKNDASLFDLGVRANTALRNTMSGAGVESTDKLQCWSTSAAVFRVQNDLLEWLQIGDSQILGITADGRGRLLSRYHNHDLQTLQQLKDLVQQGDPDPHGSLRPYIEMVRRQMNRSYGVLNGESAALEFLNYGSVPLQDLRHLLVFTDGLLPPAENPASLPDFDWMAGCYLQGGLGQLRNEIRELESSDPGCRRYPRFKKHDDIAAIGISLH